MSAIATTPTTLGITIGGQAIGTIELDLPVHAGPITDDGYVKITVDWKPALAKALRKLADELDEEAEWA